MKKYLCPVCFCRTLNGRGDLDVCPVCYWEDDGEYDESVVNDWNSGLTIVQARRNYVKYGAYDKQYVKKVRKPLRTEVTDDNIKLLYKNGGK